MSSLGRAMVVAAMLQTVQLAAQPQPGQPPAGGTPQRVVLEVAYPPERPSGSTLPKDLIYPLVIAAAIAWLSWQLRRTIEAAAARNGALQILAACIPHLVSDDSRARECALATIRELTDPHWAREIAVIMRRIIVAAGSAQPSFSSDGQAAIYDWVVDWLVPVAYTDGVLGTGVVSGRWAVIPCPDPSTGIAAVDGQFYTFGREELHHLPEFGLAAYRIPHDHPLLPENRDWGEQCGIVGYYHGAGELRLELLEVGVGRVIDGQLAVDSPFEPTLVGFPAVASRSKGVIGIVSGVPSPGGTLQVALWPGIAKRLMALQ